MPVEAANFSMTAIPKTRADVLAFYADQADAFSPTHREIAEAAARVITVVPIEAADLAANAA